jgi:hypothetical protein
MRFKVYLRSGTVITVEAESSWTNSTGWLQFYSGDNEKEEGSYRLIAQFAPGMWEGFQYLYPRTKEETK